MDRSTQPSTLSSRHPHHSERGLEFLSESSASEHSFAQDSHPAKNKNVYLSTNLVTASNITLADVIVEQVDPKMILERVARAVAHCRGLHCAYGIEDSRSAFKQRKEAGVVDTMVPFDRIEELSQAATTLALDFEQAKRAASNVHLRGHEMVLRHLFSQVAHDHAMRPA